MPELRQNPATKEWVIIAFERAKRPEDVHPPSVPAATDRANCPFCPGNELMTPGEILAYRDAGSQPDTAGWWVRIIPNKFPALTPKGNPERIKIDDYFSRMDGLGRHEVLIESPDHETPLALMDRKQVEEIFFAYRDRFISLSKDPRFEMILIFKNHGVAAGTSLFHPHSQIVATPVTPINIRHRLEEAMHYFDDNGKCVYCDMIIKEKKAKERIIMETDNFIALEPFASSSPFETWILPKRHDSSFAYILPEVTKELAHVMRSVLLKIYRILNNPDFNYVIRSAPLHENVLEYYHWFVQIFPRVSTTAGFELGSGIYINTVIPEIAAKFLCESPLT
jgi:UDPglucose--hexose-1-phosphate uridylyltransferase